MVKIKPFKGWYYDADKVDIRQVVAPPHDVISDEEQDDLYAKSEYNAVRIILPKNGYDEARKTLEKLTSDKIIKQDKKPAYYVYEQEFDYRGKRAKRLGLLALVRAEPLGKDVIPHEEIYPERSEDRYQLFSTIKANLSPIFGMYSDSNGIRAAIDSAITEAPLFEFEDDSGIINRLWPIYDTDAITKMFENEKIIIADGHHRYTASYRLADRDGGECDYTLAYLVDMKDPALKVLPTHRLLKHPNFDLDEFLKKASEFFDITEASDIWQLESSLVDAQKHTFGIHNKEKSYLLKLRDPQVIEQIIKGDQSRDLKHLEVSVLHELIMNHIMEGAHEDFTYAKQPDDVIRLIKDGSYHVGFLLRHSDVDEVLKIAKNKELMPQKSTYFYPKPLAGLIIRKME